VRSIKVEDKGGQPSINGKICTYDTREVRNEIEALFDINNSFYLPTKYDIIDRPFNVKIIESHHREEQLDKLLGTES
jgi:hypothetical protein